MKAKKTKPTKKTKKKTVKSGNTNPVQSDGELEAEWNRKIIQKQDEAREMRNRHLNNTLMNGHDRMARHQRSPACPKCDARPVVCMMRRPKFAAFRCRQCGHRWEVK